MKIRYKISTCTSQSPNNPVLNLVSGSGSWESARFCTYPQQITIMFYEPVVINKIKIVTHQIKVPAKINLLYHLPTVQNQNQFTKIGYVVFKSPKQEEQNSLNEKKPILKELKVIKNLELKSQYLRLMIMQNYQNKANFFNQVAISSLQIEGSPIFKQQTLGRIHLNNDSFVKIKKQTNQKLLLLIQFKQNCIQRQQYNQANQIKQIIEQVKQLIQEIRILNQQKRKVIDQQNYSQAKVIKDKISQIKQKIQQMTNNFYDPSKKIINKFDIQKFKKNKKSHATIIEGYQDNQFLQNKSQNFTDKGEAQNEENQQEEQSISPFTHQQRIVPAVLNKLKNAEMKSETGAQLQSLQASRLEQILPQEPEELSPSNQANSSFLIQFYDKMISQKLHSKYWQFRNQALQEISKDSKQEANASISKNKLRAYLFVYNRVMSKQNNKLFILTAIEIMDSVTGMKVQSNDFKTQLTRELQKSIIQTLDKIQDAQNPKIKMNAQKLILKMSESSIFGSALIYNSISKTYSDKLSYKLKKIYLQNLDVVISRSQSKNSVSPSIVDFAVKKLKQPNNQVRKCAVNLLKSLKNIGFGQKIKSWISQETSLKDSYLKELNLQ